MKRVILFFIFLHLMGNICASTGGQRSFTCPLCSEHFECYIQISYSVFRQNLDLKPVGAALIPVPIPKCPKCCLVFRDDLFSPEEIAFLRHHFKRNNIFAREPGMPNYYYLARELEILDKHIENIVYFFLSAVWENKDTEKEKELMLVTVEYIDRIHIKSEEYETYQLVKLDLLRRSGSFSEALAFIEELKANDSLYKGYIIKIIEYQMELILQCDRKEHALP